MTLSLEREVQEISLERLLPNPWQIEGREDPAGIEELAADFLLRGMIETPVCRPVDTGNPEEQPWQYQLASGHRRLAAHRLLVLRGNKGYAQMRVRIAELTDEQMAGIVIAENKKRQGLNPIGEAKFYRRYLTEFKVTQKELAESMGCSQGDIGNTIRLLDLPDDVQKLIISGEITPRHARELLRLSQWPYLQDDAIQLLKGAVAANALMTVDRFAIDCDQLLIAKCKKLTGAAFDTFFCDKCDAHLSLRNRAGEKGDYCNRPECFDEKVSVQDVEGKNPYRTHPELRDPEPPASATPPEKPVERAIKTERQKDGAEQPTISTSSTPPTEPTPAQVEPPPPAAALPTLDVKGLKIVIEQMGEAFIVSVGAQLKIPIMRTVKGDIGAALASVPAFLQEAAEKWKPAPKAKKESK